MGFHTFGPLLVQDEVTMLPARGVVGQVIDVGTGDPAPTYSMQEAEQPLVTNLRGYVGTFKAPDTVRQLSITFGSMTLTAIAHEVIAAAGDSLATLELLTISHIGLDVDGVPYFSPGAASARILQDTDGAPYFAPALTAGGTP